MQTQKSYSICVFCGSQTGNHPDFIHYAQRLGKTMAKSGNTLVYGGGTRGIMGAVSGAVRENGGKVIGVIPEFLMKMEAEKEVCDNDPELIVVDTMHTRKQTMFEHADAFIALPGGIGTLEEIIEIMTWAQLARHDKPIAFLNINGFWDPLLAQLNTMQEAGFIHTQSRVQPIIVDSVEALMTRLDQIFLENSE